MTLDIQLADRPAKPRTKGRTHAIDKGLGVAAVRDFLEITEHIVDLVKLGWGTSVVTPILSKKLACYAEFDIDVCMGGTLLELAYLQGRIPQLRAWLLELGVSSVEVSDGAVEMPQEDKLRLIEELGSDFTVYSEVGSKDVQAIVTPARWVREIRRELSAGAAYVILEGRESGTAGLYRDSGEIRMGLVDEIGESDIPQDRLVFEAPNKENQVWLIQHLGAAVNLGNVRLDDVIGLETLRLGLRADTLPMLHG